MEICAMDELAKLRDELDNNENIPSVFDALMRLSNGYGALNNDVRNLRRDYNGVIRDFNMKEINRDERNTELRKLVRSLLTVIDELEAKLPKTPAPVPTSPTSSSTSSPSTPSRKLGPTEVKEIVGLLTPIMGLANQRYALLVNAFGPGSPLLSRVDLEGNANVVTTLLVNSLIEYGKVNDGGTLRPALWVLLQRAKEHYGADNQQRIDNLRPYFE
jgi:hypothetical protein